MRPIFLSLTAICFFACSQGPLANRTSDSKDKDDKDDKDQDEDDDLANGDGQSTSSGDKDDEAAGTDDDATDEDEGKDQDPAGTTQKDNEKQLIGAWMQTEIKTVGSATYAPPFPEAKLWTFTDDSNVQMGENTLKTPYTFVAADQFDIKIQTTVLYNVKIVSITDKDKLELELTPPNNQDKLSVRFKWNGAAAVP